MCGIIGQICFNQEIDAGLLKLLHHRGPDGQGEWTNPEKDVYLGHTRLAILEPTPAGKQPMEDHSGRFIITFNGEIYNHLQLRRLLQNIPWRGESDTETLVELLAEKGLGTLPLLKGMFAFALYDKQEKLLLLVRDRIGIKPLYFTANYNSFTFSSEVRPLLTDEPMQRKSLSEYVSFGRFPGEGEIIFGVKTIPSGSWMRVFENSKIETGVWWKESDFYRSKASRKQDAVCRVSELVTGAINEHLISDVGIGAFLSGGIDSSIVTLIAGKALGKSLKTFTVGFPNIAYDERAIAAKVAKKAGSEHFELVVKEADCLHWVKEAVEKMDLPSVDAINTYIVSKAVRETGLKVALSGLGGDELFGGYPTFKNIPLTTWLDRLPVEIASRLVFFSPGRIKEKIGDLPDYSLANLTTSRRRFTAISKLKSLGFLHGIPAIPKSPPFLDEMAQISWAELYGYMLPMLLRDSDQMSMAVNLEIRVPFLDHPLLEEVLSIKQEYKMGKGVKPLLVAAFRNILPEEVYKRPKQGFSLPMGEWIKDPLANFTEQGIRWAAEILKQKEPLEVLSRFNIGQVHWTRVWLWCVLGHWLRNNSPKFESFY